MVIRKIHYVLDEATGEYLLVRPQPAAPQVSERQQFEAGDKAQYKIDSETYAHKHLDRLERYVDRAIQSRWETWQAARARPASRSAGKG